MSRSKLARDRRARAVARYTRRTDCRGYSGVGRWGMASYRALSWLVRRRAGTRGRAPAAYSGRQVSAVYAMFGMRGMEKELEVTE